MNDNLHAQAEHLLAKERVEGLNDKDREFLAAHLAQCERCSAAASQLRQSLAALRGTPVELPSDLVSRTKFRVHLRAGQLREREPGRRLLWTLAFMSWALGVSTAPYVWRLFSWAGYQLGLPHYVSQAGVILWWTGPALLAVGLILFERRGRAEFSE